MHIHSPGPHSTSSATQSIARAPSTSRIIAAYIGFSSGRALAMNDPPRANTVHRSTPAPSAHIVHKEARARAHTQPLGSTLCQRDANTPQRGVCACTCIFIRGMHYMCARVRRMRLSRI